MVDGRVIANVVRIDEGDTEGPERNISWLLELIVAAPGVAGVTRGHR